MKQVRGGESPQTWTSRQRMQALLLQVQEEHDRQQSSLRREVARLRSELCNREDGEKAEPWVPSERFAEDDDAVPGGQHQAVSLQSSEGSTRQFSAILPVGAVSAPQTMKVVSFEETGPTVPWFSEASQIETKFSRASVDSKATFHHRDVWTSEPGFVDEDWSPQHYIKGHQTLKRKQQNLFQRSARTMEMIPSVNCASCVMLLQRRPIPPSTPLRLFWDLSGLALIMYDICAIPLEAFEFPRTLFHDLMDWIALIFWTVDVVFSFVTGYYYNGQLVLDPHKIAIHYLTTWFFLDIAVIVPEWLTMVAGSDALSFAGIGRALRLGKAMRVVRLLRVLKLRRILDAVLERIQSEFTFLLISLFRLLFFIVLLNHVIACLWYLIGKETLASEMVNWIQEGKYEDEDQTYKYFTSLHWALTQFTPASMNVSATNVYERIFSIAVLFFAMVAFSSIVGGVTASMTQLQNLRSNHMKQFWILRRYLKQNGVGKELQFRIEKFLEYQTAKEAEHVQPAMVAHLAKLSQPLKNELQYTIMVQWLRGHPFFSKICTHMPNFMHKLCSTAIKEKVLGSGDIVFEAGEECSQVYFLSAGLILEYTHIRETAETSNRLHSKQWISEPALWTPWKHLGVCEAEKPGEIISVDTATFCKEMSAHPAPKSLCAAYARLFVECLNSMPKHTMSDVLDQTVLDVSAIVEKASHVAAALGYSTTSNSVALNSPSSAQL